jgi:hypothetical protein
MSLGVMNFKKTLISYTVFSVRGWGNLFLKLNIHIINYSTESKAQACLFYKKLSIPIPIIIFIILEGLTCFFQTLNHWANHITFFDRAYVFGMSFSKKIVFKNLALFLHIMCLAIYLILRTQNQMMLNIICGLNKIFSFWIAHNILHQ